MYDRNKTAMVLASICISTFGLVLVTGCSKKAVEVPKEVDKGYSSFSDKSVIVKPSEILPSEKAKAVQVDFDLDGLTDMAYVRKSDTGDSEVSILIQKPKADKDEAMVYYKGGGIRRGVEGKVTGLMSRFAAKYTDLILLVAYTNKPNEMIYYTNDGSGFREVIESEKKMVEQVGTKKVSSGAK